MAKSNSSSPTSLFVAAPDGLRLHVRVYGHSTSDHIPVVCLPGLARTATDFDELARQLATQRERPRRVFALDYRGRGRSEYDRSADNYTLAVELSDLLATLTALGIARAVFVGTSRGGLLTMLLGAARPGVIAGAVLNDIGPVIEPKGLLRIKGYVGKLPQPRNFDEGAEVIRRLFDAQFPLLEREAWHAWARRAWEERDGRLHPTYDVRLARTLASFDPSHPVPTLWNEFDALARRPLMVIRGANSDLLSEETVTAMRARRTDMEAIVVPDQGHTPLLIEPAIIRQIATFVSACEKATEH